MAEISAKMIQLRAGTETHAAEGWGWGGGVGGGGVGGGGGGRGGWRG